jgi:enoyl-CoA hydratase/carnithine racemase
MSEIEFTRDGHIAHVRLNRPKALNAITAEMDRALYDAWTEINRDEEIWVAVLTAEGEKAFCAGADVKSGGSANQRLALGGGLTGLGGPMLKLKKPLVTAVQGYVLGGGFELAMCADILIASETAKFGLPETKAGIIGESGVVHRAVRQLPYRVAMAMILTGERLGADDALRYGLINEVVPAGSEREAALRWANLVAQASPLANQAAKTAAIDGLGLPLDIALVTRFEQIESYALSSDRIEGEMAFAERRRPQWLGK